MFDPSSQGQLQVYEDLKGPEVQVVRVVQVDHVDLWSGGQGYQCGPEDQGG